jgi:hypothetical protein
MKPCVMPGASVLDFIDHSRRELLHRKRLRHAGDVSVPSIPKSKAGTCEEESSAFLFAITDAQG